MPKALLEATQGTNESKEFDAMKKHVHTLAPNRSLEDIQPMAKGGRMWQSISFCVGVLK